MRAEAKRVSLMLVVSLGSWGCPAQKEGDDNRPQGASVSASASASVPQAAEAKAFEPEKVEVEVQAMGTHVTFIGYTTPELDEGRVRSIFQAATKEIERLEGLMSAWKPDSEVSKLNRAGGHYVKVSPETFEVLQKSVWAGKISRGTFDVTFQALSGLWKFGDAAEENPRPPTRAEVEPLRRLVDYRRIELDPEQRRVRIGKDQQLSLGGIAKGYIVDKVAKVFKTSGLDNFLVRAGGDLFGAGKKPNGDRWVAGIQDPRGKSGAYFALIELEDHAFSTAGDYARAYVYKGKRYHHIIDPRTGFPATRSRSVTVWAESALLADAIDDAIFILGPKEGLALVESLDGAGAVIVDKDNKVWVSERLQNKVKLLHDPTN